MDEREAPTAAGATACGAAAVAAAASFIVVSIMDPMPGPPIDMRDVGPTDMRRDEPLLASAGPPSPSPDRALSCEADIGPRVCRRFAMVTTAAA